MVRFLRHSENIQIVLSPESQAAQPIAGDGQDATREWVPIRYLHSRVTSQPHDREANGQMGYRLRSQSALPQLCGGGAVPWSCGTVILPATASRSERNRVAHRRIVKSGANPKRRIGCEGGAAPLREMAWEAS
jgi:hypothetical protein